MNEWIDVSDIRPRIAYTATGGQTAFSVPFVFFEPSTLSVYKNETLLTLDVDYTVAGPEDYVTGTVTLLTGATVGDAILISRHVPVVQTTHIPPSGPLDIPAINVQISKLVAMTQRQADQTDRAIHLPDNDSILSAELASASARANRLLGFDTDGELIYPLGPTFVGTTATGVAIVDSRATAQVTTFDISVNVVVTEGLAAPGDGGGATYIRGLIGDPGAFQDAGGVYWKFATTISAGVVEVDSRVTAAATKFQSTVNIVVTHGYATYGDGGGARYKRGIISSPGAFQDANGVYWGLDLAAGIVLASWFGAVGDDATNDYTALQAGITAAVTGGFEFHLNPGKKYLVSGADLLIAIPSGVANFHFYGNGATIRTNPAQSRIALTVNHVLAVTRADQNRKVLISGLTINHISNANAVCGIEVITSPHTTIRDCSFNAGSDTGVPNFAGYSCIRFTQSNVLDPGYGSFWCRVQNNEFIGGTSRIPTCIWIRGSHNAMVIETNTFSICDSAILLTQPSTGLNANEAYIANGMRVISNDFEGCVSGVIAQGTTGWSTLEGWVIAHNRIESITGFFLNISSGSLSINGNTAPAIGPNYLDSGSWGKYLSNVNGLNLDVRDEYVGYVTINPPSWAAGAAGLLTTLTVAPASVGDRVTIQASVDLGGLLVTGHVLSANTVQIRIYNPTASAIDLPSMRFYARVRPQV